MRLDPASFKSEVTIDSNHNRVRYSKKVPEDGSWDFHESKSDKQKITYVSHCPEKQCSKYYIDKLLGRYYFICLDERHQDRTDLEGGNN